MSVQTPEQIWKGLSKGLRRQILNLDDGTMGGRWRAVLRRRALMDWDGLTPLGEVVAEHGRGQS